MSFTQLDILSIIWIAVAVVLIPFQLKITAPYGRHRNKKWGPSLPNKWGWVIMEAVSPIVLLLVFYSFFNVPIWVNYFLIALWLAHYINRTVIYPFRIKTKGKLIPWAIVLSAIFFNVINAGLNGAYLGLQVFDMDYWADPRFVVGAMVFFTGMFINVRSDNMLIRLRKNSNSGYQIPKGFLFDRISCPNLFGEVLEWTGFAIMCWNPAAWSFAIWTAANLIPRALSHHAWYKNHFSDYPPDRKAVIPGVL